MSKVYFIKVEDFNNQEMVKQSLELLFKTSRLPETIPSNAKVAVKITFGEEKNTGFINPDYIASIVSQIKSCGAKPFVTDANTIYRGKRSNAVDHLNVAYDHGFTPSRLGAPVLIADGLIGSDCKQVEIKKKHFRYAKIASASAECDYIMGIAHMTGHMLTGFGGAIKNLGMGLSSRAGKLAQHSSVAPKVNKDKCTGCGACVDVCPVHATCLAKKKCYIHKDKCIGCGECIIRCKFDALDLEWSEGEIAVQEKMAEYTYAVLRNKKFGFINFANHITAECDCLAEDDPKMIEDIGILASGDPVALDKATYDLVVEKAGEDIFVKAHPKANGLIQLEASQKLGIGSLEYELVPVSLDSAST